MKYTRLRVSAVLRAGILGITLGLLTMITAAPVFAEDDSGSDGSIIDTIIDWIEDFFNPDDHDETLPSDGDGW